MMLVNLPVTDLVRPARDHGFMYQRQLADPDGNIVEFGWMDAADDVPGSEGIHSAQAT
jgi:predicted lactoylglutathione lyase